MENKKTYLYIALALVIGIVCSINLKEDGAFLIKNHLKNDEFTSFDLDEALKHVSILHLDAENCVKDKLNGCLELFKKSISTQSREEQGKIAKSLIGELREFLQWAKQTNPGTLTEIENWLKEKGFVNNSNQVFWNCLLDSFKSCEPAMFAGFEELLTSESTLHLDNEGCAREKLQGCVVAYKKSLAGKSKEEIDNIGKSLLGELRQLVEWANKTKPTSSSQIEAWLQEKGFLSNSNQVFWNCALGAFKECEGKITDFELINSAISEIHLDAENCIKSKLQGCLESFQKSIADQTPEEQNKIAVSLMGELRKFLVWAQQTKPQSTAEVEKWLKENGFVTNSNQVFWNCAIDGMKSCEA